MASGFAFECDYCGKVEMHRGQVPAYVEPNPPKDWVRVLPPARSVPRRLSGWGWVPHYHGGQTLSSVKTFCGSTCAMGHLGAVELEESQ